MSNGYFRIIKRLLHLGTVYLFCAQLLFAQKNNPLHILTDKPFYVSGELLNFSAFLPQSFDRLTTMFRVAVHDADGNLKQTFYLHNHGKLFLQGYYFLPYDLTAGWYSLSIYQSLKTDDVLVGRLNIPIYNDLNIEKILPAAIKANTAIQSKSILDHSNIELKYTKSVTYPYTMQVTGQINRPGASTGYQVQLAVTESTLMDEIAESIKPAYEPEINSALGLVPLNSDGIMIKGQVTNEAGVGKKVTVLGAYFREQNRFYFATPNQQGKFELKLPVFTGPVHLQFIYHPFSGENIRIKLQTLESKIIKDELVYSKQLIGYLEASRQRKKIAQYFKQIQSDPLHLAQAHEKNINTPDYVYRLKDYEDFRTIGEFCKEIAGLLVFKESGGQLKAQTINPNAKLDGSDQVSGNPLFIINGKLTRDAAYVAGLDFKATESLELFYLISGLRRQFNVAGNDGVVRVNTTLPIIELPAADEEDIFAIHGILPEQTKNNVLQGPVISPVVYWSEMATTDAKGTVQFNFTHHDGRGKYRIRLWANGPEGQFILGQQDYEIK